MLTNLFLSFGINRDHVAFLWGKILSIALLINSGVFDLSAQAAYLGIHLTPTGAHWIQALAVVALYISGQFSTSNLPGKKIAALLLVACLGAMAAACGANHNPPIVNAANAEHVTVVSVHAVIQAEAAAFKAGAYDNATHQQYVAVLLNVAQSEKVLNGALKVWNQASGQPAPAVVALALSSLRKIVADVTPLLPTNNSIGALVVTATTAINLITGGQ